MNRKEFWIRLENLMNTWWESEENIATIKIWKKYPFNEIKDEIIEMIEDCSDIPQELLNYLGGFYDN